tara:strand:+ start:89 stop:316 length:228 start_codon:yes stop_codon:yes gene_type:complete
MSGKEVVIWRRNRTQQNSQQRKLLGRKLHQEVRTVQNQGLDQSLRVQNQGRDQVRLRRDLGVGQAKRENHQKIKN